VRDRPTLAGGVVPQEYPIQCWSCLGEFDAVSAVWCTCNARTPTKLCPFCFHCFCQADAEYHDGFWRDAPGELREEHRLLGDAGASVGESLIRSNLLNTDQLVSALRWQQNRGGVLDDALVDLGFVSRENLALVARGQTQPETSVDLAHVLIDASLVSRVTVDLCHRKRILPISREEIGETAVLTLAMAGPTDVETIDQIQSLTNCRIIPVTAPESDILDRLKDLFPKEVERLASAESAEPAVSLSHRPVVRPPSRPAPARPPAPSRPAARIAAKKRPGRATPAREDVTPAVLALTDTEEASPLLPKILSEAISKRASSVQVEVRGSEVSLFFRIDGMLFRARSSAPDRSLGLPPAIAARASLAPGEGPAAGRLSIKAGDRKIDLVVRRVPSPGGQSLLLKIVDPADFLRPLEDLGPSLQDTGRLRQALALPRGLVILSAPPHNGLECTRYSLMAQLPGTGRRVASAESPRLLTLEGVRQQEIPFPPDAAAITTSPGTEVLFLPEIQTTAMAAMALEQAASRLVVASIPARRASQTPAALLWHRLDAATLARRLKLVVNQRLVRRICSGCRAKTEVADKILKMMGLTSDEVLDLAAWQGSGCKRCGPLSPGYSGRVALFEVMEGTREIAGSIARGAAPGEIEREARRAGMSPLRAACLAAVGQGITTLEEFQKGNF
jgi:type IV pilus assembly protein PilB